MNVSGYDNAVTLILGIIACLLIVLSECILIISLLPVNENYIFSGLEARRGLSN